MAVAARLVAIASRLVVNVACVNVEAPLTLCSRPRRERALRIRYGQSAARICLCRPERGTVRTQRPGNPRRTRSRSLPASIPIARRTCRGHSTRPEGAARRTGRARGHSWTEVIRERTDGLSRRCFSLANSIANLCRGAAAGAHTLRPWATLRCWVSRACRCAPRPSSSSSPPAAAIRPLTARREGWALSGECKSNPMFMVHGAALCQGRRARRLRQRWTSTARWSSAPAGRRRVPVVHAQPKVHALVVPEELRRTARRRVPGAPHAGSRRPP